MNDIELNVSLVFACYVPLVAQDRGLLYAYGIGALLGKFAEQEGNDGIPKVPKGWKASAENSG